MTMIFLCKSCGATTAGETQCVVCATHLQVDAIAIQGGYSVTVTDHARALKWCSQVEVMHASEPAQFKAELSANGVTMMLTLYQLDGAVMVATHAWELTATEILLP